MSSESAPSVAPVAVVGGGPAGLIAAEVLASAGCDVVVYEHKRSVGRKMLLAGRGGLNITHTEPIEDLLSRYGDGRANLEPAIRAFTPSDLADWCERRGEPVFAGSSGRVFPDSFRATPLLREWLKHLDGLGVVVQTGHRFVGWDPTGALRLETDEGEKSVRHAACLFALGGASWPRVGSDGSWVEAFMRYDIDVAALEPANAALRVDWSPQIRAKFDGEPIKNAIFRAGEAEARGDAVVTEQGLLGGPIYGISAAIRSMKEPDVIIDLHPDLDHAGLTDRLSKRRKGASAASWLASAGVAPVAVALVREITGNQIPNDPEALAHVLKALRLPVEGLASIERAISSAGGVRFRNLDERFMVVKRPGVFVAGEMLDWEAPTGGYLLQACFSTGVAAANGVLAWLDEVSPN